MKNPKNMLVYHGIAGLGKTYLCAALTEWLLTDFMSRRYHKELDLLKLLRQGINDGTGDYIRNLQYLIDDDIVILDDVGSGITAEKFTNRDLEFRREIFFSFLDYRYNSMKPTIITSNFTKEQFEEIYSERICSRLFAKENIIISSFDPEDDKRKQGM